MRRRQGLAFHVDRADISAWYSAPRVKEDTAAYKILVKENTKRILGTHIVGPNAEEEINLFALAIRLVLIADKLYRLVPRIPSRASTSAICCRGENRPRLITDNRYAMGSRVSCAE
jgi:glutathione reductase (NADPH)